MPGFGKRELVTTFVVILFLKAVLIVQRRQGVREMISARPALIRWPAYYLLVMANLFFGRFSYSQEFIYFQFLLSI